jgi:thioesterase domain-containing protein/acyl carrier protein
MENQDRPGVRKEPPPGPTEIEGNLQRLWKDILDLPGVSPDDDFFLCGGNSLTAIELLIKIQREFHINLPPDTIYRYPTLRQQAALLQKTTATAKEYHPLIFPLREEGDLHPLFCVHPIEGGLNPYLKVLYAIDKSRPVFGIRGRGLEPGETSPGTLEEIAREEADAIRTVRKTGPYHLLGFSYGGIVAFELACQFQEQGEDVAFLGIIDTSAPAPEDRYLRTLANKVIPQGRLLKTAAWVYTSLKSHSDCWLFRVLFRSLQNTVHLFIYRSGTKSHPPEIMDSHFQANFDGKSLDQYSQEQQTAIVNRLKASYSYLPTTFRGNIILFSTGPDNTLFPGDITRGWGSFVSGKCEVIEVPGDHSSLFNESNVGVLAERIKGSLGPFS